ncbi:MAG TPA: hypothetical protein VM557_08760 [Thermoanaerobaculia bacterium]|nr:hypothetical protein [Thermoanaerobaculia bacterium]
MTGAAWLMLILTWGVIISFTSYFFIKVVRTPAIREGDRVKGAAEIDDISEHD